MNEINMNQTNGIEQTDQMNKINIFNINKIFSLLILHFKEMNQLNILASNDFFRSLSSTCVTKLTSVFSLCCFLQCT